MQIHCRLGLDQIMRPNIRRPYQSPLESKDDQYHGDAYAGRRPEVRAVGSAGGDIGCSLAFRVHERQKRNEAQKWSEKQTRLNDIWFRTPEIWSPSLSLPVHFRSPKQLLPASGTWRPSLSQGLAGMGSPTSPIQARCTQRPTFVRLRSCQLAAARTATMADLVRSVAEALRFSSPFVSAFGELLYRCREKCLRCTGG
jgi:hypothetical protein